MTERRTREGEGQARGLSTKSVELLRRVKPFGWFGGGRKSGKVKEESAEGEVLMGNGEAVMVKGGKERGWTDGVWSNMPPGRCKEKEGGYEERTRERVG